MRMLVAWPLSLLFAVKALSKVLSAWYEVGAGRMMLVQVCLRVSDLQFFFFFPFVMGMMACYSSCGTAGLLLL
jgi:hypothetical protein